MFRITIPGTVRIKKNSRRIVKAGKFKKIIPSKAYLEWESYARSFLTDQLSNVEWSEENPLPIGEPISVKAICYYKGQKCDLSGALESVGDCFEGILWKNDKQIVSWDGSRLIHDLQNPRLILEMNIQE